MLVRGLPNVKYDKYHLCPSCQLGKSKKASHPLKAENTNTEVLHTLHMDLCGPMRTESINGKKYVLVIVDDYTRYGCTLHGKTYYELLKGKKPNLQYFRVFGSLCYPTNDYDDVGKLKAKADIGIFVGYAPTKKAYRIYNKRTRKIQETVHVAFDELTEGLTSVQTSSGLAPQQMTSVPNSTELELTALQSGRSRSALVKDPEPPSVPPTKKQVDDLFQWFDDDEVVPIPPVVPITPVNVPAAPAPENANGSPSTTVISEGAPAVTESLLPHQVPLPDTSDSDIETLFDNVDSNVFDTYTVPETDSEASSSNTVNIDSYHPPLKMDFKIKFDEYGGRHEEQSTVSAKGYRQEADATMQDVMTHGEVLSGSTQFLGHRLVSWSSKKQKSTAISTTEAEYIRQLEM
ncbi:retrovirus-related pol polyprotein from transposon TNT 1-94 [Tanacetum coccineum]|uniref:Retrovirus-related pol polyprotein from transposon TNT 1-94 n=1 Tax=Tanacetum coccineum TaxID=301880 RepID=A0ABQ5H889_9ASTR